MELERRSFLTTTLAALPAHLLGQTINPSDGKKATPVQSGADRLGEPHTIGVSSAAFKVLTQESKGAVFIMENSMTKKGGPPRHLHHGQDEWFYAVQGEFVFEIGSERFRLAPGDSILGPREIYHTPMRS